MPPGSEFTLDVHVHNRGPTNAVGVLLTNPVPAGVVLVSAVPSVELGQGARRQRIILQGDPPSPLNPPAGCAFHPRCPFANERCKRERPQMLPAGTSIVACHGVEEGRIG